MEDVPHKLYRLLLLQDLLTWSDFCALLTRITSSADFKSKTRDMSIDEREQFLVVKLMEHKFKLRAMMRKQEQRDNDSFGNHAWGSKNKKICLQRLETSC